MILIMLLLMTSEVRGKQTELPEIMQLELSLRILVLLATPMSAIVVTTLLMTTSWFPQVPVPVAVLALVTLLAIPLNRVSLTILGEKDPRPTAVLVEPPTTPDPVMLSALQITLRTLIPLESRVRIVDEVRLIAKNLLIGRLPVLSPETSKLLPVT